MISFFSDFPCNCLHLVLFWGCISEVWFLLSLFILPTIVISQRFLILPLSFFCVLGFLSILPLFYCFLSSMLSSSEFRALCPSVSFLFVHLGASLRISCNFYPLVEGAREIA